MSSSSKSAASARVLLMVALCLLAVPAHAEVMDKEMTTAEIWKYTLLFSLAAIVPALIWRWLLVVSFLMGSFFCFAFPLTEWWDPIIGPAIASEAGKGYGLFLYAAMLTYLAIHIVLWRFATQYSLIARLINWVRTRMSRNSERLNS